MPLLRNGRFVPPLHHSLSEKGGLSDSLRSSCRLILGISLAYKTSAFRKARQKFGICNIHEILDVLPPHIHSLRNMSSFFGHMCPLTFWTICPIKMDNNVNFIGLALEVALTDYHIRFNKWTIFLFIKDNISFL